MSGYSCTYDMLHYAICPRRKNTLNLVSWTTSSSK